MFRAVAQVPEITISRFKRAPEAPVKRSIDFAAGAGHNVEFKTLMKMAAALDAWVTVEPLGL